LKYIAIRVLHCRKLFSLYTLNTTKPRKRTLMCSEG